MMFWMDCCFLVLISRPATVSSIVATLAARRLEVNKEVLLDVFGRAVASLKMTYYASFKSSDLSWKRRNGEVDREEVPDNDVPDTHSLKWLLLLGGDGP